MTLELYNLAYSNFDEYQQLQIDGWTSGLPHVVTPEKIGKRTIKTCESASFACVVKYAYQLAEKNCNTCDRTVVG